MGRFLFTYFPTAKTESERKSLQSKTIPISYQGHQNWEGESP